MGEDVSALLERRLASSQFVTQLRRAGLEHGNEHTAHSARVIAHGNKRKRRDGLLAAGVAVESDLLILQSCRLAASRTLEARMHGGPRMHPTVSEIRAERFVMNEGQPGIG